MCVVGGRWYGVCMMYGVPSIEYGVWSRGAHFYFLLRLRRQSPGPYSCSLRLAAYGGCFAAAERRARRPATGELQAPGPRAQAQGPGPRAQFHISHFPFAIFHFLLSANATNGKSHSFRISHSSILLTPGPWGPYHQHGRTTGRCLAAAHLPSRASLAGPTPELGWACSRHQD
jgi:hypothetical protein